MRALKDIPISDKRLLIREDLNVPMDNGVITNDARIIAALPTIQYAAAQQAAVIIMSHLGRPLEGRFDAELSLAPVATHLSTQLGMEVKLLASIADADTVKPGDVALLENVRFNVGENANDDVLAKQYANVCDIFVMDAFATAHRAHASTAGVAQFAKQAVAGPLLQDEIDTLTPAFMHPKKPLLAIVGGSKITTKLQLLNTLTDTVDQLIVGGGIANTFIAAAGLPVGKSLLERDLIPVADQLIAKAKNRGADIPIPIDVVVAKAFNANAKAVTKDVNDVLEDDIILDIGPKTAREYMQYIQGAQTIIWNGPVGVFEWRQFSAGTKAIAETLSLIHI